MHNFLYNDSESKFKFRLFCTLLIGLNFNSFSQNDWVKYLVKKDKGIMSIHLDLALNYNRPSYKNLLIVGTNYNKNCYKNGFPKKKGLDKLYAFSDSIATTINKSTKYKLAGIITYRCFGFDIYYVKDTLDLRRNIDSLTSRSYPKSDNYVMIQSDKKWDYYFNIFPESWPNYYFINHEYLGEMVSQGDDLSEKRNVDHWINFKKEKKREKAIKNLKKSGFTIDSLNYKKDQSYPYELKFKRVETIGPVSINSLTKTLQFMAQSFYGEYEGWATETILPDD